MLLERLCAGVPVPSDYVLKAYGKCLQEGYICTWRRKPLPMPSKPEPLPVPSFTNDISKELWCFWYSNDPPPKMEEFTSQLENLDDTGVGNAVNGIPYEIRILFFKALHTVIERSLSKSGYIRFGRWFTKPLERANKGICTDLLTPSYGPAFNMQFFVHGGNIVCMTLNPQRQPTLIRLAKRHLECGQRVQVVLSPWSLRGFLLPASDTESSKMQSSADRQWEEWKEFIALEHCVDNPDESKNDIPRMVLVEIDGIRMLYPSSLIAVTLEDDAPSWKKEGIEGLDHKFSELIGPTGAKRSRNLLYRKKPLIGVQAVYEQSYVKKPPNQKPDPFRKPFSAQPIEVAAELKWDFHDPIASVYDKECKKCNLRNDHVFNEPLGHLGDTQSRPSTPYIDCAPVACSKPAFPGQKRRKTLVRLVHKVCRRDRWKLLPVFGKRPVTPENDPSEHSSDDEEERCKTPSWARTDKSTLSTSLYSDKSSPERSGSPVTSEEDFGPCSPFTPYTLVSPCHDCKWDATDGILSEGTFSEICKPIAMKPLSTHIPQKDRAIEYDSYYNPTLREKCSFADYHITREQAHKLHKQVVVPDSPDQPGSQETIPATSSPPPELDKVNPNDPTLSMIPEIKKVLISTMKKLDRDVEYERMEVEKRKAQCDWPQLENLNMSVVTKNTAEDFKVKIRPYGAPFVPLREDSDVDLYESEGSDDCRTFGDATSMNSEEDITDSPNIDKSSRNGSNDNLTTEENDKSKQVDEPMEVDNGTYSILSPPASNERMDMHPVLPKQGPPSVGESLNKIYPTPPSIIGEAQQFSPAETTIAPAVTTVEIVSPKEEASEEEQVELLPVIPQPIKRKKVPVKKEEEYYDIKKTSKVHCLFVDIKTRPISNSSPKIKLNLNGRFGIRKNDKFSRLLKPTNGPRQMPPDYQKLSARIKSIQKETKPSIQLPPPKTSILSVYQMSSRQFSVNPTGSASPSSFTISFGSPRVGPSIPPTQQHPMHPMMPGYGPQSQMMMRQNSQMMMSRGIPPQYGNPHYMQQQMGYGTHPMGPPGYVNSMHPPMPYGGMGPHPQMGMGQMGGMQMGPPGMTHPSTMGMGHHMGQMGPGPQMPHGGMGPGPQMTPGSQMQPNNMMGPGGQMRHAIGMYGAPPQGPMTPNSNMIPYGEAMMSPLGGPSNMMYMQGQQYPPNMGGPVGPGMPQMQQSMRPLQQMQMMGQPTPQYPGPPSASNQQTACTNVAPRENTTPEGVSVVLAIILQDTILDLHYDTVFDSCPICSCNTSIRARELGLYITPTDILRSTSSNQVTSISSWSGFSGNFGNICNCGFSAVRHRYLSQQSGLFREDAFEATGNQSSVAPVHSIYAETYNRFAFFNPTNKSDVLMLNQLRALCQRGYAGKAADFIIQFHEYCNKVYKGEDLGFSMDSCSDYIVSQIDSTELMLLGNSTVDMALVSGIRPRSMSQYDHKFLDFFHPWGLQVAKEMSLLSDVDVIDLFHSVTPVLEEAMRVARCAGDLGGTVSIVEGPLTWKSLTAKIQKVSPSDDDSHSCEPIPYVLVGCEKDLIRASPHILSLWEELSLAPVDQPKDILYLAVMPDNNYMHEHVTKYMEELSRLYEKMRLGKHISWNLGDVKDGIVRVGGQQYGKGYTDDIGEFLKRVPDNGQNQKLFTKIGLFTQDMEEQLTSIMKTNEQMFQRSTYRQAIALDLRMKKQATSAIASEAEKTTTAMLHSYESNPQAFLNPTPLPKVINCDFMHEITLPSTAEAYEAQLQAARAPYLNQPAPTKEKSENSASNAQPSNSSSSGNSSNQSAPTPTEAVQQPQPGPLQELLETTQPGLIPITMTPRTIFKEDPPLEAEDTPVDDPGTLSQVVVIYIFNPFNWGDEGKTSLAARLSTLSLIRAFNALLLRLPAKLRPQIHLEIIPMSRALSFGGMMEDYSMDNCGIMDYLEVELREQPRDYHMEDNMKSTALSVYSAPRLLTPECVLDVKARCMTRFGPGSQLLDCVADWEQNGPMIYNIPSSPFYLAPQPWLTQEPQTNKIIQYSQEENVLFVTYCLIGDEFLCASITDAQGRMNDNCVINIRPQTSAPPEFIKYKSKTQILDAMTRLWQYIQGVISLDIRNVRLVIGRLGRIGHGEFKAWSHLLTKTSLRRTSGRTKEFCTSCFETPGTAGTPAILSACLISTEPEPYLRLYPRLVNVEGVPKKRANLNTPADTSCTHIMVFPVNTQIELSGGEQANEDEGYMDAWDGIAGLDLPQDDEFGNIQDIVGGLDGTDSGPQQSATFRQGGSNAFFPDNGQSEPLQNQPLAIGFSVSTAPSGDLPDWFWASCPSYKRSVPVHLKSSLHINVQCSGTDQDQGDELIQQNKTASNDKLETVHPLDSQRTDEVLRHVLETYNALSWLNIDVQFGERRCCLPVHMQSLLRLYHSVSRLVL